MPGTAGTDVVPASGYRALTIPDQDFRDAVAALQEQEVGEFDLTRIKIPSGGGTVWSIPGIRGEQPATELHAVVIFNKFSRAYWPGKYEGGNEPPVCASRDGRHASARPTLEDGKEVMPKIPAEKDDAGRLLCDTCSYAEFGSGEGRRQACKQMRQVFILLPDRLLPAVVTLPPTSLKEAKGYFLGLVDAGYQPYSVITRFTLAKKKNEGTPEFSVAQLSMHEELPPEAAARAKAYAESAKPRFMRVVATREDLPDDD